MCVRDADWTPPITVVFWAGAQGLAYGSALLVRDRVCLREFFDLIVPISAEFHQADRLRPSHHRHRPMLWAMLAMMIVASARLETSGNRAVWLL